MTFLAAILFAHAGQNAADLPRREMAKLDFMIGYWEGTLTDFQTDPPTVAHGYENVRSAAGGTALFDNALYEIETSGVKKPVNSIAAMIWFDTARQAHTMRIQSESGWSDQFDLHPTQNGMDWSVKFGETTVYYTLRISPEGEWVESAVTDRASRKKIFEIRLKRTGPPRQESRFLSAPSLAPRHP
ncbi:MAG: hypothetical protein JNM28_10800 [Armatimonadetes bacterium]|nr:hypothetical protein [Armatimonadota bacterium]